MLAQFLSLDQTQEIEWVLFFCFSKQELAGAPPLIQPGWISGGASRADGLHCRGGTALRPGPFTGVQDRALLAAPRWRGIVGRLCPRGRSAFSHMVAYNRQTSALRGTGTADTLLDAASYGSRWVLLSPAPAAGVARALRPRAPDPKFEFGRWLVTAPGPGPGGQRTFA